jgi:hypothetical protein
MNMEIVTLSGAKGPFLFICDKNTNGLPEYLPEGRE